MTTTGTIGGKTKGDDFWTVYKVRWDFVTKLCASIPGSPELVKIWLESRQPKVMPPGGKSIDEIQEEVFDTLANPDEQATTLLIFQRQNGALFMRAATVRAHLKDCARVLSNQYIGRTRIDVRKCVVW